MADGGGSEAVRRYEGSPERQAAGNGGILTPFVLPSGIDSALSQLPPQEIILPFDEVLGMTMIVVFILAESELAWRFLRSIIARQSALYNRGRGLILLDNYRSFPRQSASSSKEIRKGDPGRPTTLSRVQLFVVAFASSWDVLEYMAGTYGREDEKKRVRESGDNVDLKVKLGHKSHARVRVWSCSRANGTKRKNGDDKSHNRRGG